ncbi:hypothetical protein EDD85DRAFT_787596 [Armillaria nabsnona]|nr:hypothetical protein EDD85DRAFT_787596 [Armillaria nabsnona]
MQWAARNYHHPSTQYEGILTKGLLCSPASSVTTQDRVDTTGGLPPIYSSVWTLYVAGSRKAEDDMSVADEKNDVFTFGRRFLPNFLMSKILILMGGFSLIWYTRLPDFFLLGNAARDTGSTLLPGSLHGDPHALPVGRNCRRDSGESKQAVRPIPCSLDNSSRVGEGSRNTKFMLQWNELLLDPFGGEGQGDGRLLNKVLMSGAIALVENKTVWRVWRRSIKQLQTREDERRGSLSTKAGIKCYRRLVGVPGAHFRSIEMPRRTALALTPPRRRSRVSRIWLHW